MFASVERHLEGIGMRARAIVEGFHVTHLTGNEARENQPDLLEPVGWLAVGNSVESHRQTCGGRKGGERRAIPALLVSSNSP